jgi:hypothetical protein
MEGDVGEQIQEFGLCCRTNKVFHLLIPSLVEQKNGQAHNSQ